MIGPAEQGERYELYSPTKMPKASGYLWNRHMMIHVNCRGYAVAQFMQPEPAKYAYAPNLEAKTFMQPEQPYFAHHPGRFCYLKDEVTQALFSAPYEPVRVSLDDYIFSVGKNDLKWVVKQDDLELEMQLSLAPDEPLELWTVTVRNQSGRSRQLSLYPYFSIGYMSWMNQSAEYTSGLQAIIASCVSPYQKYKDYDKIKTYKDKTFLLAEQHPTAWETNQAMFEGEGGLHEPDGITATTLGGGDARYETPVAVLQYRLNLLEGEERQFRFLFGPARTREDIEAIRNRYFVQGGFEKAQAEYAAYVNSGIPCVKIKTPDAAWDNFINHWLPRQIFYHGETNRLSTDPQTRNYLQDNMGMGYINPAVARQTFLTALSQQTVDGAMPDGILIHPAAELKYINQVPHTDHCVWLPICMQAYLDETDDYALLEEKVPFADDTTPISVREHLERAIAFLLQNRDERGLSYIEQGDWCDPMNMVGPKGVGVSGWLTLATAYAVRVWAEICTADGDLKRAAKHRKTVQTINEQVNTHLWDGNWFARGITDEGVTFGVKSDPAGSIFLNPQSWALMSGAANEAQEETIVAAVTKRLESPYGVEMLGPPFFRMREDVGRVTQKHPGSAENGSIYNHAAAFYVFGLYQTGRADKAFEVLRKMIPSTEEEDILQRGQLPVFIPNYYRGAYKEIPRTAGRSSQLFNTGTVSWVYRCLLEGTLGLIGTREGLRIAPQLPSAWEKVQVKRHFRGASFVVNYRRANSGETAGIWVDGEKIRGNVISMPQARTYQVEVIM